MSRWILTGAGKRWTIRAKGRGRHVSEVKRLIANDILPTLPADITLELTLWERWQGFHDCPVTTRTYVGGKWSAPVTHNTRMCG